MPEKVHMELLEIVVFDEADRLLEMGFRQECLEVCQIRFETEPPRC